MTPIREFVGTGGVGDGPNRGHRLTGSSNLGHCIRTRLIPDPFSFGRIDSHPDPIELATAAASGWGAAAQSGT
ncbi:unnamed protein product [Urochloa humidicola]